MKDPRAVPLLIPLLNDEEVDDTVPSSLAEIGDRRAIGALIAQLTNRDPSLRVLAIYSLERLNAREALPRLRELLQQTGKSSFAEHTTVGEAARHAIAVILATP